MSRIEYFNNVVVLDNPKQVAVEVSQKIGQLIKDRQRQNKKVVLCLPTGSTPVGVYQQLVRLHREEGLDFSNVVTFNLDEYYPMQHDALQSYHRFMHENLFDHVNIPKENIHIPDGSLPREKIAQFCEEYEQKIRDFGGLDFAMLGIGQTGHIAFNEPGSDIDSQTRLVLLDKRTIKDASSAFFGESNVPREAITMGVGTIMSAREIVLMATGENKASIVKKLLEEKVSENIPATFLQKHKNTTIYIDMPASAYLIRTKSPWLVKSNLEWDAATIKRAVVHVAQKQQKPIMELDTPDFESNLLHTLLHKFENSDKLCEFVFKDVANRIQSQQEIPSNSRVLVFSPHPDDDVISMGGMLDKLAHNNNEITVAYQTNGSVAVHDNDVRRHLRFCSMSADLLGIPEEYKHKLKNKEDEILQFLENKKSGDLDPTEVQRMKSYVRYAEAISALEVLDLHAKNAKFLDLPFYKTGTATKNPIGQEDVQIILNLIKETSPDHIFVAGDLTDPHGTHRMCYEAIRQATQNYNAGEPKADSSYHQRYTHIKAQKQGMPLIWLYRGAWQEWDVHEVDVYVPLSKSDLERKINAIFKHQSQKDKALYPGSDTREFWQRARDRNISTAQTLGNLGFPKYFAMEAFVTCYEMPI